jgi:hypothetical protein
MQQRLQLWGQLLLHCPCWRLAAALCMLGWQRHIMLHQLLQVLLLMMTASMLTVTMWLRHLSPPGHLTRHWKPQIPQQQQQQQQGLIPAHRR